MPAELWAKNRPAAKFNKPLSNLHFFFTTDFHIGFQVQEKLLIETQSLRPGSSDKGLGWVCRRFQVQVLMEDKNK